MAVVNTPQVPTQPSGNNLPQVVWVWKKGAVMDDNGNPVQGFPMVSPQQFATDNPHYSFQTSHGTGNLERHRFTLNPDYYHQTALNQADANFNRQVSGGVQETEAGSGFVGGPSADKSTSSQRRAPVSGRPNSQGSRGRRRSLLAGGYSGVSDPAFIGQSLLGG